MQTKPIFHTLIIAFAIMGAALIYSFTSAPSAPQAVVYEYSQFSTVESVIPGGLGRSRIIATDEKGAEVEKELQNLFSMVGINFSNVTKNDVTIVNRVNEMTAAGWELYSVTPGSFSNINNGSSNQGIFLTRYLFRRVKA